MYNILFMSKKNDKEKNPYKTENVQIEFFKESKNIEGLPIETFYNKEEAKENKIIPLSLRKENNNTNVK